MSQVNYTGHGARTGGLQGHSVGPLMPYMIQAVGRPDGLSRQVLDSRTGNLSRLCRTYREAEIYNRTKSSTRCDVKIERRRPQHGWPMLAVPTLVVTEIKDF